ncbi:MAG: glycoside hydrolase family 127 protein [Candidatus Ancaeobacter aquaticus]|nr:glycoside hydrolase family 127 protein [Candidatus Ancaeobacter aquaticus]
MKSLNLFLKCVSLVTVVIFLSTSMVWAVPHTQTLKSSQNALAADSKLKEDQTQFKAEYNEKERNKNLQKEGIGRPWKRTFLYLFNRIEGKILLKIVPVAIAALLLAFSLIISPVSITPTVVVSDTVKPIQPVFEKRAKLPNSEIVAFMARYREQLQKLVDWHVGRYNPKTGLCNSFADDHVKGIPPEIARAAHTFDQALWIMKMDLLGAHENAAKVLQALSEIQNPDGYFCNTYDSGNRKVVFQDVHPGPNAFVIMAVNLHVFATGGVEKGDKRFVPMASKVADYLISRQGKDGSILQKKVGPITVVSVEENEDCYSAFYNLYMITGEQKYLDVALKVKQFLLRSWNNKKGCFYMSRMYLWGFDIPYTAAAYDTSVWGYMLFGDKGDKGEDYRRGLEFVEKKLLNSADTGIVHVEADKKKYPGVFWLDPTCWLAISELNAGNPDKAKQYFDNVMKRQFPDGGLPLNYWDGLGEKNDPYPNPVWKLHPYGATTAAVAAQLFALTVQNPQLNIFHPSTVQGITPIKGITVKDLPGTHMTIPTLVGQPVSSAEETNEEIRKELSGEGIRVLMPSGKWILRKLIDGKINEKLFVPLASLDAKVKAAKMLLGDVVKEMKNIPAGIDRAELVRRAKEAEYGFTGGYTIGKDVLAHAGRTYNCIYLGREMVQDEDISASDIARVMLEDALHFVVKDGDPEHMVIQHSDTLKKKLVSVVMVNDPLAKVVANDMAQDVNRSKVPDVLSIPMMDIESIAKAKGAYIQNRPKAVFVTVSPDIVNLHNEIDNIPDPDNTIVIPVYDKNYVVPLDYVTNLSKKYPNLVAKPIEISNLQAVSPQEPFGVAAIQYANKLLEKKGVKVTATDLDAGWLNSSEEKFKIKNISSDKTKILEINPKELSTDPASKEIHNIGSLLAITITGISLHQQLGDDFEKMTFAELVTYIDDPALKTHFRELVADLMGMKEDEVDKIDKMTVAEFIKAPLPVTVPSESTKTNYSMMRAIMTAA